MKKTKLPSSSSNLPSSSSKLPSSSLILPSSSSETDSEYKEVAIAKVDDGSQEGKDYVEGGDIDEASYHSADTMTEGGKEPEIADVYVQRLWKSVYQLFLNNVPELNPIIKSNKPRPQQSSRLNPGPPY